MNGKFQGDDVITIQTPRSVIWEVLIETKLLYQWMPIVKNTTGEKESLNAVRTCDVEFQNKTGLVTEKCILFQPMEAIGWEMQSDDLGFSNLFNNYGFSFELEELTGSTTRITNKGFYTPKNIFAALANFFIMKRKSSSIRQMALANLKNLSEELYRKNIAL